MDLMRARGTLRGSGSNSTPAAAPPNATLVPVADVVAAERSQRLGSRSSGENGLEDSRLSDEGRRPLSVGKAPVQPCAASSPAAVRSIPELPPAPVAIQQPQQPAAQATPKAKRPRENSMVALYKAMVEPQLQIDKTQGDGGQAALLKGKITSAKKFRRSSMLKQAQSAPVSKLAKPLSAAATEAKLAATVSGKTDSVTVVVASPPKRLVGKHKPPKTAGGENGMRPAKKARPPVPTFCSPVIDDALSDCQLLKHSPLLSPKKPEDNYEISDKEEDSDDNCEEHDRSHKFVPQWCANYLELLAAQATTDPDTIFGCKVPRCDLDLIFSDDIYRKFGRNRPVRRRGSSGEWKKDRLRPTEIHEYKHKMGQTASWTTTSRKAATLIATPAKIPPAPAH
jgi:hypothetical protein